MYNEELEQLILAALADGEVTDTEKKVLFKKAESMGIDLYEFQMVLDARIFEIKKKKEEEKAKATPQPQASSNKYGVVQKCPSCGAPISGFQARCPECGYEFKGIESVKSANQLFEMLQQLEMKKSKELAEFEHVKTERLNELSARHNSGSGVLNAAVDIFGSGSRKERQDEEREDLIRELNKEADRIEKKIMDEKANVIKNFPVPNTKEDLLELLSMASSNAYDNDGVIGKEEEVWVQKTDQIYQKIILISGNDKALLGQATNVVVSLMKRLPRAYKNFTKIPAELQDKIRAELQAEKEKKKQHVISILTSWKGIGLGVSIILLIIGFVTELVFLCLIGLAGAIVLGLLIKNALNANEDDLF